MKPHEYEKRVRAVRKRLALDFQPLRETLSRGLDVLIDAEAAVLCTATIEAMCDALFSATIKNLHDEAATSLAPLDTKVTIYHIQVALRSHPDFAELLRGVESAAVVLEYFMDDASSRALYQRRLIATREAKHLRSTSLPPSLSSPTTTTPNEPAANEDELIALHERTRSEWQKREDDPFTDVDFSMVLKCVHPAFTLAHSATMLLSALVRELLNEVCDRANVDAVQRRVPPELYVDDVSTPLAQVFHVGTIGQQIDRTASECLERFRLRSRQGASLTIKFRVFTSGATASQSHKANSSNLALANIPRETKFGLLLPQMCKKCHLETSTTVAIFRGHQVEASASLASLSMPTGGIVYLVSKKWWDHTRRNEARRGQLCSLRPQAAHVRSIVDGTESKVKKEFHSSSAGGGANPFGYLLHATSPSSSLVPLLRRDDSLEDKRMMAKTQSMKSIHAATASRLMNSSTGSNTAGATTTTTTSTGTTGADQRDDHAHDHDEEGDIKTEEEEEEASSGQATTGHRNDDEEEEEEDSLTRLLKQKLKRPRPQKQCASNNSSNRSPVAREPTRSRCQPMALELERAGAKGGAMEPLPSSKHVLQSMASQSTQLMDTLDEAWLGFAGISASVRALKEQLQRQIADGDGASSPPSPSPSLSPSSSATTASASLWSVAELEKQLLGKLEKTSELVRQTTEAHELVAQLLQGAARLRKAEHNRGRE